MIDSLNLNILTYMYTYDGLKVGTWLSRDNGPIKMSFPLPLSLQLLKRNYAFG